MIDIAGKSSHWRVLHPAVFSTALRLKSAIDKGDAMKGMTNLATAFPTLTSSLVDDEDNRIALLSKDSEDEERFTISLEDQKDFELTWGLSANVDWAKIGSKFYGRVAEDFGVFGLNVETIDIKFLAFSDWQGNHYTAIHRAFYAQSPLSKAIPDDLKILRNNLNIITHVGRKYRLAIAVRSDVIESEIIKNKYQEDNLVAYFAVADVAIAPNEDLQVVFSELTKIFEEFIDTSFLPHVATPLDQALAELSDIA